MTISFLRLLVEGPLLGLFFVPFVGSLYTMQFLRYSLTSLVVNGSYFGSHLKEWMFKIAVLIGGVLRVSTFEGNRGLFKFWQLILAEKSLRKAI